jgi:hypothetical protein
VRKGKVDVPPDSALQVFLSTLQKGGKGEITAWVVQIAGIPVLSADADCLA